MLAATSPAAKSTNGSICWCFTSFHSAHASAAAAPAYASTIDTHATTGFACSSGAIGTPPVPGSSTPDALYVEVKA
ncbi:Uncharacterised protein [Mycobacteroides abscessus subsp. abscessus]|nr:Uncharacterised protein [Mycobacteroides abscessus subsp. abscessus]